MWFHRPFRMDDWLLYEMESPNAAGGKGFALGRLFSRDGRLVASTAQEGVVRVWSKS
jgi:acyl-CoA thioesterase-2